MDATFSIGTPGFWPKTIKMPRTPLPARDEMKSREKKNDRFGFVLEPSLRQELKDFSKKIGEDESEIARVAIKNEIAGRIASIREESETTFSAPYLANVPCGPLGEALTTDSRFTINSDVDEELETRDGDFWVRAKGESMVGAGILHGFMVLMRPLDGRPPRPNDIVLIQFFDENSNVYEGTMKRWIKDNPLHLVDGQGKNYPIDEGRDYKVIAVAKAVIGRL